ncbi:right-handed parallel beta-helix repeat-containing protein [Halobacterium zhouii]|uniref:right-handed parallel beta-helix repeat-containing protein n=1 Tax=Halobacterium zhouii TaxID=2902624 RepID=UPI001E5CFAAE|nr:right-handed parallel beta-helix repeat-containing protein [Halobacterium zhouii]
MALTVLAAGAGVSIGGATTSADRGDVQQATTIDTCTTIDEPGTYRLTESIENGTADTCIEIRASDVHFDGGGHTIDGPVSRQKITDALQGPPPEAGVGIGVHPGDSTALSNVTVTNVAVTEWFRGISVRNTSRTTIHDVTVSTTGVGVDLAGATGSTVVNATASENVAFGVQIVGSPESTVQNVTANDNGFNGVHVVDSVDSTVRRVTATANGFSGVEMTNSSESTVRNVTATENGFRGFGVVDEPIGNVVENMTVVDNNFSQNGYAGIVVFTTTNSTFRNNSVAGTQGMLPPGRNPPVPSAGIIVDGASGNVFTDTDARNQSAWAYVAVNGATNTVRNLQTDGTSVSFEARDVALGQATTGPPSVDDGTTLAGGVTVTNTSADAFIDLEVAWTTQEEDG